MCSTALFYIGLLNARVFRARMLHTKMMFCAFLANMLYVVLSVGMQTSRLSPVSVTDTVASAARSLTNGQINW